ncbi:MAG: LLM class F420-dependent oxidoreductase [Actinobacteria bacterium]|nr:LLM class F420-dependent oxidoreductase [Actinomycetota bacterium]MBM3697073.1 LLM class F420-dependent oxidoreductase [Actinomycetota bacterium]
MRTHVQRGSWDRGEPAPDRGHGASAACRAGQGSAYDHRVRIGIALSHMAHPATSLDLVAQAEGAGADEAWIPETWGFDAPTLMGAIAARTARIRMGAVLPVYSRSPALIAQTIAGADALSGGRAIAGLGTSGPQVVEGWHGVPFARPLGELREAIAACRTAWSRDVLEVDGPRPIPLPPGQGTGLGKPLRMITRPHRERVPIVVAALAPGGVRLAAELADGWWPLFATPDAIRGQWGDALAQGAARREVALGPLSITTSAVCWVGSGDGADAARAAARREIAFYVGSMGSRDRNYYRDAVSAMGFAGACDAVRDAALAGRARDAEACVSDAMVDALALIGAPDEIAGRLDALRDAGVTCVVLSAATPDPVEVIARLRAIVDA